MSDEPDWHLATAGMFLLLLLLLLLYVAGHYAVASMHLAYGG